MLLLQHSAKPQIIFMNHLDNRIHEDLLKLWFGLPNTDQTICLENNNNNNTPPRHDLVLLWYVAVTLVLAKHILGQVLEIEVRKNNFEQLHNNEEIKPNNFVFLDNST